MTNTNFVINFKNVENLRELAQYIQMEEELLEKAIKKDETSELYKKHLIPKRKQKNKHRIVFEVRDDNLAVAYKNFARKFDLFLKDILKDFPHKAVYGYIKGRSILDNARNHCGIQYLLRADIDNFFSSISKNKLIKVFNKLDLKPDICNALADFVTIDDNLPLGLPSSPMLANLVCFHTVDPEITLLADQHHSTYTRYADDITISSGEKFQKNIKILISDILGKEGFKLSDHKFRISKLGQTHYVTGLSVSDKQSPHVPRFLKRKLRQELYFCKKFGIENHLGKIGEQSIQKGINRLDGLVNYITFIESSLMQSREEWRNLLRESNLEPKYCTRHERPSRNIVFYVDETEFEFEHKKFLALAFVQIKEEEEEDKIKDVTNDVLEEHVKDPYSTGRKDKLKTKKLHWADSPTKLKDNYIGKLEFLPFKAYLIYSELKPEGSEHLYLSLIQKILHDRLMSCDGDQVKIIFDNTNKSIEECIENIYNRLESSRRPNKKPETIIGNKSDFPCLSVPDYLLNVFSNYAQYDNKEEYPKKNFERLRDKYRLIVDNDSNKHYSRKNPFKPWKSLI